MLSELHFVNFFFLIRHDSSSALAHHSRIIYIMPKKCPYSELFWSVFSRIGTTDQNNFEYGHFLRSDMKRKIQNFKEFSGQQSFRESISEICCSFISNLRKKFLEKLLTRIGIGNYLVLIAYFFSKFVLDKFVCLF